MKILWFNITPSLATEKVTGKKGIGNGWVASLEQVFNVKEGIELAVAFPGKLDKVEKFQFGNTQYYSFPSVQFSKYERIRFNHSNRPAQQGFLKNYLECIEDFQPDVILIFGTENNFGTILPHTKVPVLIWLQGILTVYTHMWFNGFSSQEVYQATPRKKKLNGKNHINNFKKQVEAARREQATFQNSKYLLGRTIWDKRIASVLAPQASYFHCDEVLRDEFYQTKWTPHTDRDKFILMTTIQNNLYKGLEVIFGCGQILKRLLGDKFEWRIAGISKDHDLLKMAERKLNCSANSININPLGRIPSPQLIGELLNANVFVHPSHIDNSPNSVCEAMIIGLPVISTNTGGVPDILENRKDGLLFQPGDIWALSGAILEYVNDPEQAINYGQSARNRALERHNPDKIANRLVEIAQQVAQQEQA